MYGENVFVAATGEVNHQKLLFLGIFTHHFQRVRQGMGRCQAGFCTPRTMEILSRELGISMEEVCKNAPGSEMLKGHK